MWEPVKMKEIVMTKKSIKYVHELLAHTQQREELNGLWHNFDSIIFVVVLLVVQGVYALMV